MTNLIAAVTFVCVTNWTQIPDGRIASRQTNTVATVVWKGQTNSMILESTVPIYFGKREPNLWLVATNSATNYITGWGTNITWGLAK